MRFRDRPLLVDGLDASLYVERPGLEQSLVDPLTGGRNVLLLGDAGSGKSTLLRQTAVLLERRQQPAVLVNAALADDAGGLLELVGAALDERLGDANDDGRLGGTGAVHLLEAVRRLRRDTTVAILIDGLVDANVGYDTFGRLRDELWGLGHVWAVAARPRDSGALRTPPANAFWASVVEIPALSQEETERLLDVGLSADERRVVDRDRPISGVHPRYAIRAAEEMLNRGTRPVGRLIDSGQEAVHRATELGRSEAMAVAELAGLGRPVTAHDPELLERLGWSRAYAQRILSNLEREGLLRSVLERNDRPGRPRKLYEINPELPPKLHDVNSELPPR
jgi:energy-coupling factor transporter ATP-binding protein EcfA2